MKQNNFFNIFLIYTKGAITNFKQGKTFFK